MTNENQSPADLKRLDEALQDGKQINLGDGLRVVARAGKKQFQARFRAAGVDTTVALGLYPDMSVEEAYRRKDAFLQEKRKQILDGTPTTRRTRAKASSQSDATPSHHCLRTEAHCWSFLRAIIRLTGISLEDRYALVLMLAIPASPRELIDAKWEDLQFGRLLLGKKKRLRPKKVTIERDFGGPFTDLFAELSQPARRLFDEYRMPKERFGYIFPTLHDLQPSLAERRLDHLLQDVWPSYKLRARDLRYTFELLAKDYSEFKPEFIESIVRKRYKSVERHQALYNVQVRVLIEWWGTNLERLMNMEDYKSMYDMHGPQIAFFVGPFSYPKR